jgi:hypothetical protein
MCDSQTPGNDDDDDDDRGRRHVAPRATPKADARDPQNLAWYVRAFFVYLSIHWITRSFIHSFVHSRLDRAAEGPPIDRRVLGPIKINSLRAKSKPPAHLHTHTNPSQASRTRSSWRPSSPSSSTKGIRAAALTPLPSLWRRLCSEALRRLRHQRHVACIYI